MFGASASPAAHPIEVSLAETRSVPLAERDQEPSADAAAVERLVALLGLAEPGGAVLLTPGYAALADALAATADVDVVVYDTAGVARTEFARAVRGLASAVPFTDGTFRAAALDVASAAFAADAVRAVAPRGRVLGAIGLDAPAQVTILARDAREWVGERGVLPGPVVTLGRRGG